MSDAKASISWRQDGVIARVLIANIGHLNAINTQMWEQLADCMRAIGGAAGLRVVEITGADGAFAAGADISEFARARSTRDQVRHFHEELIGPALQSILHCPLPVVAAIDGPCVGGGLEIASVCDLRVASDRSRFGIPINRLGFGFAPSEAACLVALVGKGAAMELLLEGRILSAAEAYQKGLVNRVLPEQNWRSEVEATLGRISAGAPHAARRNKWLINLLSTLDEGRLLSPDQREACWDFVETADYRRGVDAFLNKTTPKFEDN